MTAPQARTGLVIGGGIVGLSVALSLQARGIMMTIFDAPGPRPPASWGNAGHIATEQHEPLASWATIRSLPRNLTIFGGPASFPLSGVAEWLPFGLRLLRAARPEAFTQGKRALSALLDDALPAWRRLAADAGAGGLLKEQGYIAAWESSAGARRGRAGLSTFESASVSWRDLTAEEAALLRSQLKNPPSDAVRFVGTASLADPGAMLEALRAAFLRRGGALEARGVTLDEARKVGADLIVVAAGVRSRLLMAELGLRVPLIAERGYHIQAADSSWPENLPSVVFEERTVVANRLLSGLRLTSFVEFTRPDAPADPRKWRALEAHAAELGLSMPAPLKTWFGSRPTLPDYLPAIGRSSRDPKVFYAFGHQHLGLTLGPVTGEIVADIVCGQKPAVDPSPFAIERFG